MKKIENLGIVYEKARAEDINSVVLLHKSVFVDNYTSMMNSDFLLRYYEIFLNDPFYFLVAKKENEIVGFIVGVTDYTNLAKHIKRNINLFILPIIKSLLNFNLLPRTLKRVFNFSFKNRANSIPLNLIKYNEITSFCVDNEHQGLGIGKNLLNQYLSIVCNKNLIGVFITTDAIENNHTLDFYKKNGFDIKHSYFQSNERKMYVMQKICA